MAITWYGNQSEAEGCHFGALAMLWPLLERMQVASIIDRHLPADPQAEFTHGRVLSLLIAARTLQPGGVDERGPLGGGKRGRYSLGHASSRRSTMIGWDARWTPSSSNVIRFWRELALHVVA